MSLTDACGAMSRTSQHAEYAMLARWGKKGMSEHKRGASVMNGISEKSMLSRVIDREIFMSAKTMLMAI
jgi:hypothetical protein